MKEQKVPFFPPDMFESDRNIIYQQVYEAGTSNRFILQDKVRELESKVKEYTGAKEAVAVHSGTGAVSLALMAIGVGPGDEVITQPYCCQPVASEVIHLGARPVFVDLDPDTLVMDPSKIEEKITKRTKAILPAHLFSNLVNMPKVREIANKYGLKVVEDACVQQGARLDGIPAGLLGDIGTWSFFQMKVMGGIGEGGMILTHDSELAERCRSIRNHGQHSRFNHKYIGVNSRMDEIMAGYLLHRFKSFDQILQRRREIAKYYTSRLSIIEDKIKLPPKKFEEACFYMYTILTPDRPALQQYLISRGVYTHVYYPIILPNQKAFLKFKSSDEDLPLSERVSEQSVSIPIYPTLTQGQMEHVANCILAFYQSKGTGE